MVKLVDVVVKLVEVVVKLVEVVVKLVEVAVKLVVMLVVEMAIPLVWVQLVACKTVYAHHLSLHLFMQ